MLLNCHDAQGESLKSMRCCGEIITCLQEIFPPNHIEIANYSFHLANTCLEVFQDNTQKPNNAKLRSKIKIRGIEAAEDYLRIRQLLFGGAHSASIQAENLVERLKSIQ